METKKMKTKTYVSFLVLGSTSMLSYFCLMASTNYWQYFYDTNIITYVSIVFCVSEIFGSLALYKELYVMPTQYFVL